MSKIFLASTFATLLCASLAAQATQTPPPSSAAPAVTQPAPGGGASPTTAAPAQSAPRQAAKADTLTVEGCIQRAAASATAGAAGTSGSAKSDSGFILASAMKPAGTSGSTASSAPIASSYRLDADMAKLTPHVGHKVEISGTVQPSTSPSASAPATPTLKVDNVRMIAATCTP